MPGVEEIACRRQRGGRFLRPLNNAAGVNRACAVPWWRSCTAGLGARQLLWTRGVPGRGDVTGVAVPAARKAVACVGFDVCSLRVQIKQTWDAAPLRGFLLANVPAQQNNSRRFHGRYQ